MTLNAKIKTRDEIIPISNRLKSEGKKIVFTNGVFDLLHRGHVEYLEKASGYGDILIIGINSDESVKRLKSEGRPVNSQEDRAYLLASLAFSDYISVFDEDTPFELIKAIQPDILIKGGDYQLDQIVGRDIVENRGGKVFTIPLIMGKSTTDIINRIRKLAEKESNGIRR